MSNFLTRLLGIDRAIDEALNQQIAEITEAKTNILVDDGSELPSDQRRNTINIEDLAADARMSGLMTALFSKVHRDRIGYKRDFESVRNFYITDTILTNMAEDALTPDISTGDILSVYSENEKIQKALSELQKSFDLDDIINDITYDLLSYGEYTLRLEVDATKGLINIHDDLDQGTMLALYKQGHPFKFLRKEGSKIILSDPHKYAHFMLSAKKIRIETLSELLLYGSNVIQIPPELESLPRYVRVGRPILYGTLAKIKELMLLEQLVPAIKLSSLTTGSLVSVEVPPTTEPKEAFKIARQYEQLFNRRVGIDRAETNSIGVSEIIATAGRVKVIPTFGGKGNAQTMDIAPNSNTADLQTSVQDSRDVICTSAGIPTELLFGGSTSKTDLLKRYARYFRKIKTIQGAVARGVVQICLSHLNNIEGMPPTSPTDINVQFRNETVNIDELEKLEYHDAALSMIKNSSDFVQSVEQEGSPTAGAIDLEDYKKWLRHKIDFLKYSTTQKQRESPPGELPQNNKGKKVLKPMYPTGDEA